GADPGAGGIAEVAAGTLNIGGVDLGKLNEAATGAERATQVVAAINAKSSDTGVFAREVTDTAGDVTGYEIFSTDALDAASGGNLAGLTGSANAAAIGTAVAASATQELVLEDI